MEEIIATNKGGTSFPPHPIGQYGATCIDIIDRGEREKEGFGRKRIVHEVTLRFFCGEWFEDAEGKMRPHWVDMWFTLSTHEKATLRQFLDQWRGKPMTEQEAERFNVAVLLHKHALIQVVHKQGQHRTYARINSIMALPKGQEGPGIPEGYVREKDRPKEGEDARPQWQREEDRSPLPF